MSIFTQFPYTLYYELDALLGIILQIHSTVANLGYLNDVTTRLNMDLTIFSRQNIASSS